MIQITCNKEIVNEYKIKDNDELTVGRNNDCNIILDFPTVSRKHLKVRMEHGRIYITDLGSANGTYFNKTKIEHNTQIEMRNYDKITLGDCEEKIRFITKLTKQTKEYEIEKKKRHRSRSYSKESRGKNDKHNKNKHIEKRVLSPRIDKPKFFIKPSNITEDNLVDFKLNKNKEDLIREFLIKRKNYDLKEIQMFKSNLKTLQ